MANQSNSRKISRMRTFADDVSRIKSQQPADFVVPKAPAEPKTPEPIPLPVSPPPQEMKKEIATPVIETPPPPPKEPPVEVPPFHAIRASGPEDSTFTNEEEVLEAQQTPPKPALVDPKREDLITETTILDKEMTMVQEPPASVHVADGIFDAEEAMSGLESGTIVTDQKRSRFNLFSAIGAAFAGWFGIKRKQMADLQKPKHTVVRAEERKATITAAGDKATQAPRDDHEQVSDRLQNVDRIIETKELEIKDEEAATPQWHHINEGEPTSEEPTEREEALESLQAAVEPETPVLELENTEAEESEVVVEDIEEEGAEVGPPEIDEVIEETEPAEPPPLVESEPEPIPPPLPKEPPTIKPPMAAPKPPIPTKPRKDESGSGFAEYREKYGEEYNPRDPAFDEAESLPPPPEEPPTDITAEPRMQRQEVPDHRLMRVGQPKKPEQRGTPLLTMVAVIFAAVILGVGTTVWWFTRGSDEIVEDTAVVEEIVATEQTLLVELGSSRAAFFANWQRTLASSTSVTTIIPTINNASASTLNVLAVLEFSAPSNLIRSVTDIILGSQSSTEPFIVMKFTSFDTVFAGMLRWESNMTADLAPIFGESGRTTGIDSRVNNRDVRVLIDQNGTDQIVYGFIDKNTLLITTDRNAYSAIAPKID